MPTRLIPPGYPGRVTALFARYGVSAETFVHQHPELGRGDRVRRWLRTLPETQANLEQWAMALGTSWQWLVVGDWTGASSMDSALQQGVDSHEEGAPVSDPTWTKAWRKFRSLYYRDVKKWQWIAEYLNREVPDSDVGERDDARTSRRVGRNNAIRRKPRATGGRRRREGTQ